MATFHLNQSQVFPAGTTVGAYLRTAWPRPSSSVGPSGSAVATAVVADDTVGDATFSGLAYATRYYAAAQVSGSWRWVAFQTAAVNDPDVLQGEIDDLSVLVAMKAAANTFTKAQTISPDSSTGIPLKIVAHSGQSTVLQLQDSAAKDVLTMLVGGGLTFGHASAEALINYKGLSDQVQFQTGLDVANAPAYSDLVLAARAETWDGDGAATSVSDFVIVRNGHSESDPPRLGVGTYPVDADNGSAPPLKGVVESGIWATTNGKAFANFIARVRNNTAPVQTGPAFAVTGETNATLWKVGVDGKTTVLDSAGSTTMAELRPTGVVYAQDQVQAGYSVIANYSDGSNQVKLGDFGPAGEQALWVCNAGTTLYRESSYRWRTPGYLTMDRCLTVGGSHNDNEVVLTLNSHSSTQTANLITANLNSVAKFQVSKDGGLGVYGVAPPAQPARAVTLADVIAVLAGCGLTA